MHKRIRIFCQNIVLAAVLLCSTHCSQNKETFTTEKEKHRAEAFIKLLKEKGREQLSEFEIEGIQKVFNQQYDVAQELFGVALKLAPESSSGHFLNAFNYHMMAKKGDKAKLDLAEIGYAQAHKFNPTNSYIPYFQGILSFERGNYKPAQDYFAEALIQNPKDSKILHGLAIASYYAKDIQTAAGAIAQALRYEPENPIFLHAASIISAAAGDDKKAQTYKEKLISLHVSPQHVHFLNTRLQQWKDFHQELLKPAAWTLNATPNYTLSPSSSESNPSVDDAQVTPSSANPQNSDSKTPANHDEEMVIVDLVIILSEESFDENIGINLFKNLQLMLGSNSNSNTSSDDISDSTSSTPSSFFSRQLNKTAGNTTIVRNVSIPSITYSLNIFNTVGSSSEVLARPSLVARNGQMAKFFSGDKVTLAFTAPFNSVSVYNKTVGVTLNVTPRILDNGKVSIQVHAERTFFAPVNEFVQGLNAMQSSDTTISSDVVMNFHDTLILGGLSEKRQIKKRDSVPFLGDVPILQNFFNQRTFNSMNRSVIILVTPRHPDYTYQTEKTQKEYQQKYDPMYQNSSVINELKSRYIDWFKPHPNLSSAFAHIQKNELYKQFRTGDVSLQKWYDIDNVVDRFETALDFVYY